MSYCTRTGACAQGKKVLLQEKEQPAAFANCTFMQNNNTNWGPRRQGFEGCLSDLARDLAGGVTRVGEVGTAATGDGVLNGLERVGQTTTCQSVLCLHRGYRFPSQSPAKPGLPSHHGGAGAPSRETPLPLPTSPQGRCEKRCTSFGDTTSHHHVVDMVA
jgi:hypothetical protein